MHELGHIQLRLEFHLLNDWQVVPKTLEVEPNAFLL